MATDIYSQTIHNLFFSPGGSSIQRRDTVVQVNHPDNVTSHIETPYTNVTATGLHPQTQYDFSVVAETAGGRGHTPNIPTRIATCKLIIILSFSVTTLIV